MHIKQIIVIIFFLFNFGLISSLEAGDKTSTSSNVSECGDANPISLCEKYLSFQALDASVSAILDGILTSSKNDTHLSKKQSKLLEEYVGQNKLFCQKGFDEQWMSQLKNNLDLLEKTEQNRIAPVVKKKMQSLFSNKQC
jgi:hypothetical protein